MKNKVLFCSPRGITGGICQWTEHILNYYANSNDDLELKWFYTNLKKKPANDVKLSIFRVINGIINYAPFIKYLKKELDKDSYNV
jgi:hypothetical protein